MAFVEEDDVLELDVSVHDVQRVHVVQGRRELDQQRLQFPFAYPSFRLDVAAEITPRQELHDQMRSARSHRLESFQKATDQRTIGQLFHDPSFLLDALPLLGVLHLRPFVSFYRYLSSGEFVPGDPHGAEGADTYDLAKGVKVRQASSGLRRLDQ
jgi:hypothetical protein